MKSIRLLPVVIMAVAALFVLKTMGLVLTGSYVLGGVTAVQAAGGGGGNGSPAPAEITPDGTITLPDEPTMYDSDPTLADDSPTVGQSSADEGGHGGAAPAEGEAAAAAADHGVPASGDVAQSDAAHGAEPAGAGEPGAEEHGAEGTEEGAAEGTEEGGLEVACAPNAAVAVPAAEASADHAAPAEPAAAGGHEPEAAAAGADCVPLVDAVPTRVGPDGNPISMVGENGQPLSEEAVLESLNKRRTELETYEQELTLRSSLVDAAEKKLAERQATLEALETQISSLVDQRTAMESGQFAGIVTLYENMKPKDAAAIFNTLDMEVLLRVAKMMNPRKMSPILAAMDATRAQDLTVRMAALSDQPTELMTPEDLAALPQIVGQ